MYWSIGIGGYLLFLLICIVGNRGAIRGRAFSETDDVLTRSGGSAAYKYVRDNYGKSMADQWWSSRTEVLTTGGTHHSAAG